MQTVGLRERKKSQTREQIAQAAADLFRRDGFDRVTVDAVARAAGVSKKTVFNYFPTKEDLVFDRAEDRVSGVLAAVHERGELSVLESFRRLCLGQVDNLPRLRLEVAQGSGGFFDLVKANPSLQRKAHEVNATLIRLLAEALSIDAGTAADDPVATVVAGALIGAQRALYLRLRDLAGGPMNDTAIAGLHRGDTNRVFDQLSVGLGEYPVVVTGCARRG